LGDCESSGVHVALNYDRWFSLNKNEQLLKPTGPLPMKHGQGMVGSFWFYNSWIPSFLSLQSGCNVTKRKSFFSKFLKETAGIYLGFRGLPLAL